MPRPPSSSQRLVEAWAGACDVALADLGDAGRKRQFAVAKRLADDGLTAADVTAMVGWLSTQDWRQGGVDLLTVEANRARWVAAGKPSVTAAPPAPIPRRPPKAGYSRDELIAIARGESP